jgi:hypothetical protein
LIYGETNNHCLPGAAMSHCISSSYSITPLAPDAADRAYPLIRAVAPDMGLHEWRRFCQNVASPLGSRARAGEREEAVLATNSRGYAKGLCIYSIRDHWFYGRLLDVPIFVAASAADATGVAADLLQFLQTARDRTGCSGVRFWAMSGDSWARRLDEDEIRRTDHGFYMPQIERPDRGRPLHALARRPRAHRSAFPVKT